MSLKVDLKKQRERLVENLRLEGLIRTREVERSMLEVPRENFVPHGLRFEAYLDRPLPIGRGQTISAPHMVAIMAEEMRVEPGMKVLEIGTGSGYHAAVVSRLVGEKGSVITVERISDLAREASKNLKASGISNVRVIETDGSVGYPAGAPYDRIYYTCAAPDIPDSMMEQLAQGGIMLGVVGPKYGTQRLIRYSKTQNGLKEEKLTYCVFVPLVGELGY
ncbi:MAG: protein-L-isoaspartate(D-aspartate) O-methyltransferase [Thermoplasmatota archaeon]